MINKFLDDATRVAPSCEIIVNKSAFDRGYNVHARIKGDTSKVCHLFIKEDLSDQEEVIEAIGNWYSENKVPSHG